MSGKLAIRELATEKGVQVNYSGKEKTMYVTGEKAKSFVTICNFKGGAKVFGFKVKAN